MKRLVLGLLLALGVLNASHVMPASAQQAAWRLVDAQNTAQLFTEWVRGASLSPDGTIVAGTTGESICIFRLTTAEEKCFSLPENAPTVMDGYSHNPLVWSPDSRQLAFTENLYLTLDDSDIWVLDIETGDLTNRTDDGIHGGYFSPHVSGYLLDYLPAFAPNGDLYFFRSQEPESFDEHTPALTLTLQRLPPGEQEPVLVADLMGLLPRFSIFYAPSISPDGTQLVFPVHAGAADRPEDGLWVVDLVSGEARQLTDALDAATGVTPSATTSSAAAPRYATVNPVWAANGAGIVFMAYSTSMGTIGADGPGQNYLYVDVATGEVTPLVDLADFPEGQAAFTMDANGESPVLRVPRFGAVSADGAAFVYLRHNLDRTNPQLAVLPLPPDGSEPHIIRNVEYQPIPATPNVLMGANGAVLLAGWLYTFE